MAFVCRECKQQINCDFTWVRCREIINREESDCDPLIFPQHRIINRPYHTLCYQTSLISMQMFLYTTQKGKY